MNPWQASTGPSTAYPEVIEGQQGIPSIHVIGRAQTDERLIIFKCPSPTSTVRPQAQL